MRVHEFNRELMDRNGYNFNLSSDGSPEKIPLVTVSSVEDTFLFINQVWEHLLIPLLHQLRASQILSQQQCAVQVHLICLIPPPPELLFSQ